MPWTTEVRAGGHTLLEKAMAGESVRIGFANEVPWAYPGEDNEPLGFVNAIATGILTEMGITNIEPVVTDWGGLIPGLNANRFDIITGGMYILASRCENVTFSEPIGVFGDAFIVPAGNPKGIQTYDDIRDMEAVIVTGAGYNIVEVAKKEGIDDSNIMQVPGPTEILAAVRGRPRRRRRRDLLHGACPRRGERRRDRHHRSLPSSGLDLQLGRNSVPSRGRRLRRRIQRCPGVLGRFGRDDGRRGRVRLHGLPSCPATAERSMPAPTADGPAAA